MKFKIKKCLNFNSLESFTLYENKKINLNYSLIDISYQDEEATASFDINIESFIDTILNFIAENKTIYLSLNLSIDNIKKIESLIKEHGIIITRKETDTSQIVINASKTTEKTFLKNKYSVYIFILPYFNEPVDLLHYIKDSFDGEIYIDSSNEENFINCLKSLTDQNEMVKYNLKDSAIFNSYEEIKQINNNCLIVSDAYYRINMPRSLTYLDLCNLSKKDCDLIKNFVKIQLIDKFDINIKTCQICTPSSPKEHSKTLNSLVNKIKFSQFRANVTCEIFKDYTIGIVVWNEMFTDKKYKIPNEVYIYQTTNGKWRYTPV